MEMKSVETPFQRGTLSNEKLIEFYEALVYPRLIEEKMLNLLRQGKISKWFSGIGQEAISVGAALALDEDSIIFPLHRNLGVFTTRKMPLKRLFAQWQGKMEGYTKGRDRSFHFGSLENGVVGMISHLGPQLSLANGVALADALSGKNKVALAFTGEGGTSQGEFHEALNVASVWQLPVIFLIENNGYGLSTTTDEQYKCATLADRGIGYGMKSITIDGNNLLEVYHTIKSIKDEISLQPEPFLVECMTFRMRGHEEASGTKYVPSELMEKWALRDPVLLMEDFLQKENVLSASQIVDIKDAFKKQIARELKETENYSDPSPDLTLELQDVFKLWQPAIIEPNPEKGVPEKRFIDAISESLSQSMEKFPNLILMGQDIAEYGGAFKITEGFVDKFGKNRVRNTPLCESAIIGAALGLSLKGYKSMVEMQFADFVSCGFNQIINNLAKIHYRWGAHADVVIRMPTGGGMAAGPFHSQSNEAWFFHTPGLKVVYPSNPYDAKGLLATSIEDPNPVLFFEHKGLYRSVSGPLPTDYYTLPLGKAAILNEGNAATLITYGMGVIWAKEIVQEFNEAIEIIDLRTLWPLDEETILSSIKKTGKAIILHEDTLTGGIGGEISALISEKAFEFLDAPVLRVGGLDSPIPFSPILEKQFMPKARLREKLDYLLRY
ncbi:MAG: dehydrogenase [Bacteroidetes bacterium]|nr:dehydrogenase [Bacteroidota bacterium]